MSACNASGKKPGKERHMTWLRTNMRQTNALWSYTWPVWNIYQHLPHKSPSFVGKYISFICQKVNFETCRDMPWCGSARIPWHLFTSDGPLMSCCAEEKDATATKSRPGRPGRPGRPVQLVVISRHQPAGIRVEATIYTADSWAHLMVVTVNPPLCWETINTSKITEDQAAKLHEAQSTWMVVSLSLNWSMTCQGGNATGAVGSKLKMFRRCIVLKYYHGVFQIEILTSFTATSKVLWSWSSGCTIGLARHGLRSGWLQDLIDSTNTNEAVLTINWPSTDHELTLDLVDEWLNDHHELHQTIPSGSPGHFWPWYENICPLVPPFMLNIFTTDRFGMVLHESPIWLSPDFRSIHMTKFLIWWLNLQHPHFSWCYIT